MQEIQIETILTKARNLKSIIEEPLATKVLEIELNASSAKNQELLSRVIRSLDQYVNKEETLVYVGFVGHYSSGKSTTINNILALNETADERSTGLNPTDKAITLITDVSNSNALILMNRESGNVPVRTSLIHNELLEKLVIADTPGSGDPQVVNEMIQDFLPICDYIVYFISAANPIDQADLPLLQQKTHKLPFIPIIFVITRTDEFRINKTLPLNEKNIDLPKRDQFIGQLLARIKEIVKTETIKIDDFIFIDNEFQYKVDDLRQKLFSWAANVDKETLVRIHGYKVEYYRSNLNAIYYYFIAIIDEKIKKSRDFVKTANENILRFDKSIELNNEKLRLLWTRGESLLKEVLLNEKKSLDEIVANSFPRSIVNTERVQLQKVGINKGIEDLAKGHLGRIVSDLINHLKQRLRETKQNLIANVNDGNILMEKIDHLFPGRIDFTVSDHTIDIDFSKLNDYGRIYQKEVVELITEVKIVLRNKINQFKAQIGRESIINVVGQLYEQGEKNINENFDDYFDKIQMYKGTVLTRNTKETIEKLRIGTQLDQLDVEFSNDFIAEMKAKAIKEVYFPNHSEITELQRANESLNSNLIELRKQADTINIPHIEHQILTKETVDISSLIVSLINQAEANINKLYQNRLNDVLDKHSESYKVYNESSTELRRTRKKKIFRWTALVGLGALFIYFGLRFSNVIKPSTITVDVFMALVTAGLGNLIGNLYSRFKNDIKKLSAISRDKFVRQQRSKLLQMFNEDFWEELSSKATELQTGTNLSGLKNLFNQKMEAILKEVISKNEVVLANLHTENNKLVELAKNYQSKIEYFYTKHVLIFQEVEINTGKIEQITKYIKETAIKPSFDVLNETTANLEEVRLKIQTI